MKNPLVSIIIPVYNGSNFVGEAIDSALAQTYKNIEIIVVNDGSKDDEATENIALSYKEKIRYFKKENGGVSSALNLGIEKMKGDYFSWLSHDDLYLPEKIEKQINLLKQKEYDYDNTIVLCSGSLIDKDEKNIAHYDKTYDRECNGVELFKLFMRGYSLNGLGFLIPRQVFVKSGNFDENMRYLQDLDLWLRFFQNKDYKYVLQSEKLVVTRCHSQQVTVRLPEKFNDDRYAMGSKYIDLLSGKDDDYSKKIMIQLYYFFVRGKNLPSINITEEMLKSKNLFTFKVKIVSELWKIKGRVRNVIRNIYNIIFIKGKRKND